MELVKDILHTRRSASIPGHFSWGPSQMVNGIAVCLLAVLCVLIWGSGFSLFVRY
jgi:hypothetical protein